MRKAVIAAVLGVLAVAGLGAAGIANAGPTLEIHNGAGNLVPTGGPFPLVPPNPLGPDGEATINENESPPSDPTKQIPLGTKGYANNYLYLSFPGASGTVAVTFTMLGHGDATFDNQFLVFANTIGVGVPLIHWSNVLTPVDTQVTVQLPVNQLLPFEFISPQSPVAAMNDGIHNPNQIADIDYFLSLDQGLLNQGKSGFIGFSDGGRSQCPVGDCDFQDMVIAVTVPEPPAVEPNDSQEPGSVIVFPKFVKGSVTINAVVTPKTEIEVSVLCPKGTVCAEGTKVKLRGHWVCPGSQNPNSKFICKEVDFSVFTTVNGTITLNPSRVAVPGSTTVPAAPCNTGFLVMWVIDTSDRPVKFDGLIGDAVIRHNNASAESYNAIPIQAVSALATNALVPLSGGALSFDGATGYRAVPGVVSSTVRFDRLTGPQINTFLTMLTLDVLSNRPNFPTFVDLVFWNQDEVGTSVSTDFLCWAELSLTTDIDGNLDEVAQGSRKGSLLSDPAEKVAIFGVTDTAGPVTLLGLVETQEFTVGGAIDREYSYSMYNDSTPVPTKFHP